MHAATRTEFARGGKQARQLRGKMIIIPALQTFILPTSAGNLIPGAYKCESLTTCYKEEQALRDKHQIKPQINQSVLGQTVRVRIYTLQFYDRMLNADTEGELR